MNMGLLQFFKRIILGTYLSYFSLNKNHTIKVFSLDQLITRNNHEHTEA